MQVLDFDAVGGVLSQIFAQLGDENVHALLGEVIVVLPDFQQGFFVQEHFVLPLAEQLEQLGFLGAQPLLCPLQAQRAPLGIEGIAADLKNRLGLRPLPRIAQQHIDFQQQYLGVERLHQIVGSAELVAFDLVFLQPFGGEEHKGRILAAAGDGLRQGEAILVRHHHIQDAEVEAVFPKDLLGLFPIGAERGGKAIHFEENLEHHPKIGIVFGDEDALFTAFHILL